MSSETSDKHIRVPTRIHDRIKALKGGGEAVDRLIGGYTLLDFATETEWVDDAAGREELEQTMVSNDT